MRLKPSLEAFRPLYQDTPKDSQGQETNKPDDAKTLEAATMKHTLRHINPEAPHNRMWRDITRSFVARWAAQGRRVSSAASSEQDLRPRSTKNALVGDGAALRWFST